MKPVNNKLRVIHIPQVPMKGYFVNVRNEREAYLVGNALINQHLFLYEKNIIPDYSNVLCIEMYRDNEWTDYYNESEDMDWDELVEEYKHLLK